VVLQVAAWVIGGALFAWLPFQAWVKSAESVNKPSATLPAGWNQALGRAAMPDALVLSVASVITARGPAWQIRHPGSKDTWLSASGDPLAPPDEIAVRGFAQSLYKGPGRLVAVMRVSEGFRLQGYRVVETGGGGADGGIDLVLNKDGEKYLVQCKQWRAFRVGVDVVRELYGVMAAKGAACGFVVTSGRFTDEARKFAEGRNVQLIDGTRLRALIKQAAGASRQVPARPVAGAPSAVAPADAPPSCPICMKAMVRRTAKRGANVGNEFWGCSGYPSCKGTRPIG
jgi:hypothetical protein